MSKTILLNQNWIFSKEGHDEPVTLPHTWNAIDGQDGGNDYYRGTCSYTTVLPDIVLPENGRAVLQFDAVAMTAEVYLNEQKLAEHKGGYSAFCVDITDALRNGSNLLRVNVDNSDNDTVYPQKPTSPSTAASTATSVCWSSTGTTSRWITSAARACRSRPLSTVQTLTSRSRPGWRATARSSSRFTMPPVPRC